MAIVEGYCKFCWYNPYKNKESIIVMTMKWCLLNVHAYSMHANLRLVMKFKFDGELVEIKNENKLSPEVT